MNQAVVSSLFESFKLIWIEPELTQSPQVTVKMLCNSVYEEKCIYIGISWVCSGFSLDRDGNVLGLLVQTLRTQSEL